MWRFGAVTACDAANRPDKNLNCMHCTESIDRRSAIDKNENKALETLIRSNETVPQTVPSWNTRKQLFMGAYTLHPKNRFRNCLEGSVES